MSRSNIMLASTDSYKEIEDKSNLMWQREVEFQELAKATAKISSKYLAGNSELSSVECLISESLSSLLGEITDLDVSPIGNIMKSIGKLRAKMVNQVINDFLEPLKEFIEFKFGYAQYLKSNVKKSVREYQQHLDQFEKGNIIKDGKVAAGKFAVLEKDLHQVKETINLHANQYGKVIKDLEHKKTSVLRQAIKCMEAHKSFYQNIVNLFDEITPKMEEIIVALDETEKSKSISKEGYLLAKRGKNNWSKEYFELRDEKLYNFRLERGLRYSGFMADRTMELNLCSIKMGCPEKLKDRLKEGSKRCFQIFTPQRKPLVLLAPTKAETQSWVDSLLSAISQSLDNSNAAGSNTDEAPIKDKNTKVLKIVRSVPGNLNCVDCDAEEPVWASINLGVLMCLECSGVHRYLGTHITKVRSLTLDHWDPEQLIYMLRVGNEKANHFLECNIPEGYEKPVSTSSRADRERFIIAKYKEKLFIPPLTSSFNINSALYDLVSSENGEDVMNMVMLLFYGGDLNYTQNEKTLLAQSVSKDNWLYTLTLILFGVDLFQQDEIGWTPFHHAASANSYQSLLVLIRNGKDRDINSLKDNLHQNPIDIANIYNHKESKLLLSGDLTCVLSIDKLLKIIENGNNDFSAQSPVLVSFPSEPSSPVHISDGTSPRGLRESDSFTDSEEISSHIIKSAWKRGGEEKSAEKNAEKRPNRRISVLVSSITKDGSRKSTSELVKDEKEKPSLSGSIGKDKEIIREHRDSRIINLIKGRRNTIAARPNGKELNTNSSNAPNTPIVSNASSPSNSNSELLTDVPRFRKVPPSIEILELFPNFEKDYINNLSASINAAKEAELNELLEQDSTDDEYDEEYYEFNPPDFEPPPPPDAYKKIEYTAEDIENALNDDYDY